MKNVKQLNLSIETPPPKKKKKKKKKQKTPRKKKKKKERGFKKIWEIFLKKKK